MDVPTGTNEHLNSIETQEKPAGCVHYKRKSKFVVSNRIMSINYINNCKYLKKLFEIKLTNVWFYL